MGNALKHAPRPSGPHPTVAAFHALNDKAATADAAVSVFASEAVQLLDRACTLVGEIRECDDGAFGLLELLDCLATIGLKLVPDESGLSSATYQIALRDIKALEPFFGEDFLRETDDDEDDDGDQGPLGDHR